MILYKLNFEQNNFLGLCTKIEVGVNYPPLLYIPSIYKIKQNLKYHMTTTKNIVAFKFYVWNNPFYLLVSIIYTMDLTN